MTQKANASSWFAQFRSEANLQADKRGNVAAILVVLERLRCEDDLRVRLQQILQQVPNTVWRGWAALSLVVTEGEGQIAKVTGDNVSGILLRFGIAAKYIGVDGGRSSRGNFGFVRRLLGILPPDRIVNPNFIEEIEAAQTEIVTELVIPELRDNYIEVELSATSDPESVIGELLKKASLKRADGGVAQHLVGAKLARRFDPTPIDNYSVFASDRHLHRVGDFQHGHEAFHVTVVSRPSTALPSRLNQNRAAQLRATLLVPRKAMSAYAQVASEYSVRLRSIEAYVGDNLLEMGNHDPERTLEELRKLIDTHNTRVREVEREHSGLEIKIRNKAEG